MMISVRLNAVSAGLAKESPDVCEKILENGAELSVVPAEVNKRSGHIYRRLKTADFSRHQGIRKVNFGTP